MAFLICHAYSAQTDIIRKKKNVILKNAKWQIIFQKFEGHFLNFVQRAVINFYIVRKYKENEKQYSHN